MIITSTKKLEAGKIYTEKELQCTFIYKEVEYEKYAFFVLREATEEEFRIYVKEIYPINPEDVISRKFFYQISMD